MYRHGRQGIGGGGENLGVIGQAPGACAMGVWPSSGQICCQSAGRSSRRVTLPPVARSISTQRSIGTGRLPVAHALSKDDGVFMEDAMRNCNPRSVAKNSASVMPGIISASPNYFNSAARISLFSSPLNNQDMQNIEDVRLDRLRLLVKEHGSQTALAQHLDKSPAQVSQWINRSKDSKTGKPRTMDSNTARAIEAKCKKPAGWMDTPLQSIAAYPVHTAQPLSVQEPVKVPSWPFLTITPDEFAWLTESDKAQIEALVKTLISARGGVAEPAKQQVA